MLNPLLRYGETVSVCVFYVTRGQVGLHSKYSALILSARLEIILNLEFRGNNRVNAPETMLL
jgi:hypothetical protein